MAYMSQERKKEIAAELKEALKGSGIRYSLRVRHHSTIVMTVQSGPIDFEADWISDYDFHYQVNVYHYRRMFEGASLAFLEKVLPILNRGNFDKSDSMTDYFHVGWYVDVNLGRWDRPYQVAA